MKKASNHQDERRARWVVLCGQQEYTDGVGGVQNENSAKSRPRSINGYCGVLNLSQEALSAIEQHPC